MSRSRPPSSLRQVLLIVSILSLLGFVTQQTGAIGRPVGAAPLSAYSTAVLADGPSSYWRLGETSGSTATDQRGAAPGTYSGHVTLGQPGALTGDPDPAVALDGSSALVSAGSAYNFAGTAAFTLEAWVAPTIVDGQYRRIVSKEVYDSTTNPPTRQGYALSYTNGALVFSRFAGQSADELFYGPGLAANTW